ncbi:MAG TPA: M56 family metallopeptidase [Gemmatimonadaceae bacterium]|nr:M56 family metallopeptidase [Gemmatimonadaceae bacterium]
MSSISLAQALFVIGAKSSLIFLGAALVTFGMRRRAAAARHLIWLGAIAGAALLPALGALVPAWNVPVLGGPSSAAPSLLRTSAYAPAAAPIRATVSPTFAPNESAFSRQPLGELASASPSAPREPDIDGALAFFALWGAGAVLFMSQILFGALFLIRVRKRATPVANSAWNRALQAIAGRDAAIPLLVSGDIDVPVTWGILRPMILLPREADEWSQARRELVLRHELAHITRHDVLTQVLARVVRALYWPNPLVWFAEGSLRHECEQACDDAVLAAGVRPTRYAEELLAIVSELGARPITSLAPAFATRPSLETRLHALLDARLRRRLATRFDAVVTGIAVVALAVPLAAMKPAERARALNHANHADVARVSTSVSATLVSRIVPNPVSGVTKPSVLTRKSLGALAAPRVCAIDGRSSHMNSTQEQQGMKTWEAHWSGRDCAVDLRAQGDIQFNDDLTDITSISRDGFFDLSVREGEVLTRLVVKPAGQGELDRRYTVDGAERPWDARTRDWFAEFLLELDRQTGFAIDVRFPKLLARGVPAVFDEIDNLRSDYVRGLYFQRLIERAHLSPLEVRTTLELAGRDVRSDYELARILVAVSDKYGLPDEDTRAAFLKAVNGLSSDYERNRALFALLSRSDLSPREASAVLQSASVLKSDYELARTLVAMTEKKLISPSLHPLYLEDVAKISSDYERARVILALLGTGELAKNEVAEVIGLASTIKSDYERARVLVAVADAYNLGGGARDAYLKAARSISSEYERGRALAALREARSS